MSREKFLPDNESLVQTAWIYLGTRECRQGENYYLDITITSYNT